MIYILIPTFNDSENFKALFQNIKKSLANHRFKIIIVNDGSTDNTEDILKKLKKNCPVVPIGYKKNQGPGYAFKYGFNYLIPKLKNQDLVITMESDNTADFKVIEKMLTKIKKFDVVLASPLRKGGRLIGMDFSRVILSYVAGLLDILVFRISGVRTYSSFFRIYRASILKKLKNKYGDKFITESGFTSVLEILIKLSKLNAKIVEVPATIDWTNRKGKSKMKIAKTIDRHLQVYKNFLASKYDL